MREFCVFFKIVWRTAALVMLERQELELLDIGLRVSVPFAGITECAVQHCQQKLVQDKIVWRTAARSSASNNAPLITRVCMSSSMASLHTYLRGSVYLS